MFEIKNLIKTYGDRTVLRDVSFRTEPGRVTGFLGPNAAGKSSTLRILLGLDRPTAGIALVGARAYRSLRDPLRTVGSMLDGCGAHRSHTARAHLGWVAASHGIPARRVREVLDQVGLAANGRTLIGRLSLGLRQRLALATALLGEPAALVLDEPTNGLDPDGIRWMRTVVREQAAAGGTVLLSSHLMTEVAAVADDLVVIAAGRIVAAGPLARVTAGYATLEDAFFALTATGGR
ncbi:ABC transporter ATP-binding protein [Actinoplanes sp. L3-i22]|uniref:ABC transporter ATP-binding protein n=1 Tax=Actinoplanes sp. L3-i22 TaxID=2836373 RepID=UPI001C749FD4|nr:ATP-binding cassette domain-containing protein [Actinoplanes sp. L3-i22]BCY08773.1 ABC transporter ATP-binding protein [Actinoplanes sp. L3-i22]